MPIFNLESRYRDTWVVLDRSLQVVDSGDRLDQLRSRHGTKSRRTFCFVSGPMPVSLAPRSGPWSLRSLLGHPPATLALS